VSTHVTPNQIYKFRAADVPKARFSLRKIETKTFLLGSNIFLFGVKCESVCKIKDWYGIKQGGLGRWRSSSTPLAYSDTNVYCFIESRRGKIRESGPARILLKRPCRAIFPKKSFKIPEKILYNRRMGPSQ
jgi:hypothetical protein